MTNTIQSISIELRTETGQLLPFSGTGKVLLTLQFKKLRRLIKRRLCLISLDFIDKEEVVFGALAAGNGRVAPPLARSFNLPTAKRIGEELLKQSAPEILDVVGNKKSPKQAIKNTISKTVTKQTGGSRQITSRRRKSMRGKPMKLGEKRKKTSSTHRAPKRSRSDF